MPSVAYPILSLLLILGWPFGLLSGTTGGFTAFLVGLLAVANGALAIWMLATTPLFAQMCDFAARYRSGCANVTLLYMPLLLLGLYLRRAGQTLLELREAWQARKEQAQQPLHDPLYRVALPRGTQRGRLPFIMLLSIAALTAISWWLSPRATPPAPASPVTPTPVAVQLTTAPIALPDLAQQHLALAQAAANPALAAQEAEIAASIYQARSDQSGRLKGLELAAGANFRNGAVAAALAQYQELGALGGPGGSSPPKDEYAQKVQECQAQLRLQAAESARPLLEQGGAFLKQGQADRARDCGLQVVQLCQGLSMTREVASAQELIRAGKPEPSPPPAEPAGRPVFVAPTYIIPARPAPTPQPALPTGGLYPQALHNPGHPGAHPRPGMYGPGAHPVNPPQQVQTVNPFVPRPSAPVTVPNRPPAPSGLNGGSFQPSGGSYKPPAEPQYPPTR